MPTMTEPTEHEIQTYEMPSTRLGMPVIWYRNGTPTTRHAQVGWIVRVGNNTVTIHLATGHNIESVKHISDPRLHLGGDQREFGAWDYTEDHLLNDDVRNLRELVEAADIPNLAKLRGQMDTLEKVFNKTLDALTAAETKIAELEARIESLETEPAKDEQPAKPSPKANTKPKA